MVFVSRLSSWIIYTHIKVSKTKVSNYFICSLNCTCADLEQGGGSDPTPLWENIKINKITKNMTQTPPLFWKIQISLPQKIFQDPRMLCFTIVRSSSKFPPNKYVHCRMCIFRLSTNQNTKFTWKTLIKNRRLFHIYIYTKSFWWPRC